MKKITCTTTSRNVHADLFDNSDVKLATTTVTLVVKERAIEAVKYAFRLMWDQVEFTIEDYVD